MAISKQSFYEGAALHLLMRTGEVRSLRCLGPYFVLNESTVFYLKYSTKIRSPWGFTFTPDELRALEESTQTFTGVVGLVCGGDGVAALDLTSLSTIAVLPDSQFRISCTRLHREHYEVRGPNGVLAGKIAPSDWLGLANHQRKTHASS